jgi:adenosylcobinamide kinase / adenosylcobinamide-phosphate guanylyltransferase
VEASHDLPEALRQADDRPVLVDALGTWLAASTDFAATATTRGPALVAALVARTSPTIVVSEEVGLGVHPSSEVGRRFRDALGLINQQVAAAADDVILVMAGRALRLDPVDQIGIGDPPGP